MSGQAASKKSGKANAGTAAPSKPSLKVAANAQHRPAEGGPLKELR